MDILDPGNALKKDYMCLIKYSKFFNRFEISLHQLCVWIYLLSITICQQIYKIKIEVRRELFLV